MFGRIRVRHPGYPAPNTLFVLPASDGPTRDRAHYPTIRAACAVLVESTSEFWLSRDTRGQLRVQDDSVFIEAGEYFLHLLRDEPEPFPIYPNFRRWPFPHGCIPLLFHQASHRDTISPVFATDYQTTGETCRVTNKQLACETSHIIPTSEKAWFADNEMDQYGQLVGRSGEAAADSPANRIQLKRDAHWLWDNLQFSIVPREISSESKEIGWFTQMMIESEELYEDWHNKRLLSLRGRAPEYIFARFAWSVFPKLHSFLQTGQGRRLAVRKADGEVEVRVYNSTDCRAFTLDQGRGRSASPTKRARPADDSGAHALWPVDCCDADYVLRSRGPCCGADDCPPNSPDSAIGVSGQSFTLCDTADSSARHLNPGSDKPWVQFSDEENTRGRKRRRT